MTTDTFTASGVWVCPPGITSIIVECIGGGGGGNMYGGGGGGAYAKKTIAVTPLASYSVHVGQKGVAAESSGGDSWFSSPSVVMAKGGELGNDNETINGFGGKSSLSVGDEKHAGGNGFQDVGAGGGSSGGYGGDGPNAESIAGAVVVAGGGAGGNGSLDGRSQDGGFPGGGGGGGYITGTPADGAGGSVSITY